MKDPLSNSAVESVKWISMPWEGNAFLVLKKEYHEAWLNMTRANISRAIAICLDNHVLSAPMVSSEIPGGQLVISGGQDNDSRMLAAIIGSVCLPISLSVESVDLLWKNQDHCRTRPTIRFSDIMLCKRSFSAIAIRSIVLLRWAQRMRIRMTVRREFGRIYYQDLPTIVTETKLSAGQVDMFLDKVDLVLSSFKARLNRKAETYF